ncbi:hypothetical protein [Comamonas aquatica]|uniref:hypothetical protein n=1 Tax=Comamonas aquatica TaxID=225991 RepID=UPI0028D240D5|nr:hypothetical protein [Comamonas aquatica]
MTHTSTEQERELKDIEQALRLVREAHQHEVDAYRPELYKPECDRRPKPQLDRLGDLICLLQNILYAAQQASRRAQVVPQGWNPVPVELLERIQESLGSFVSDQGWSQSDMDTADALDGLLAAAPQPPEAAPVQLPEPVAYQWLSTDNFRISGGPVSGAYWNKLYTEQQVRDLLAAAKVERKPLTDSDIGEILDKREDIAERADGGGWHLLPYAFARAIERAHGIQEQST